MRKCWRQHLQDGSFGMSPIMFLCLPVWVCVFVLFVGLSHSVYVLVSLRNGKCVKTIQLRIYEKFVHFCVTQQVVVINSYCVYVRHLLLLFYITSSSSHNHCHSFIVSAWYIWLVLNMRKGYNQNCSTFVRRRHRRRRLTTAVAISPPLPPPPNCWSIKNVPSRFLGLINRPYTFEI